MIIKVEIDGCLFSLYTFKITSHFQTVWNTNSKAQFGLQVLTITFY